MAPFPLKKKWEGEGVRRSENFEEKGHSSVGEEGEREGEIKLKVEEAERAVG